MRLCATVALLMLLATPDLAAETDVDQTNDRNKNPLRDHPVSGLPEGMADAVVVYSASWCLPCQRLKPVIGALKKEGYKVVYRDVDRDMDRLRYQYTAVPTIFYLSGEAVIKKETGYRSIKQIKKTLTVSADQASKKRATNLIVLHAFE